MIMITAGSAARRVGERTVTSDPVDVTDLTPIITGGSFMHFVDKFDWSSQIASFSVGNREQQGQS
ncbi:hypothetical protein ACQBAU_00905 [Propionibacteriaceae bacterium Y2011]|uniref:hypothetical protein n=1 Tax=Microlunatus sp. Y2014 TaxID=3418488 RepID=UPI003B49DCF7